MTNARLVWFHESNGLLSNIQYRFRQGQTTLDKFCPFWNICTYYTTWKYGILKDGCIVYRSACKSCIKLLDIIHHQWLLLQAIQFINNNNCYRLERFQFRVCKLKQTSHHWETDVSNLVCRSLSFKSCLQPLCENIYDKQLTIQFNLKSLNCDIINNSDNIYTRNIHLSSHLISLKIKKTMRYDLGNAGPNILINVDIF